MVAGTLEHTHVEQQTNTIKGTVVDERGEPLIGVNAFVKGSTVGAIRASAINMEKNVE